AAVRRRRRRSGGAGTPAGARSAGPAAPPPGDGRVLVPAQRRGDRQPALPPGELRMARSLPSGGPAGLDLPSADRAPRGARRDARRGWPRLRVAGGDRPPLAPAPGGAGAPGRYRRELLVARPLPGEPLPLRRVRRRRGGDRPGSRGAGPAARLALRAGAARRPGRISNRRTLVDRAGRPARRRGGLGGAPPLGRRAPPGCAGRAGSPRRGDRGRPDGRRSELSRARPRLRGRQRARRRLALVSAERPGSARRLYRNEPGVPAGGTRPRQPGELRERGGRAGRPAARLRPPHPGRARRDARAGPLPRRRALRDLAPQPARGGRGGAVRGGAGRDRRPQRGGRRRRISRRARLGRRPPDAVPLAVRVARRARLRDRAVTVPPRRVGELAALAALLLFVAGRCLWPMDETDLFFNLRLGDLILAHHAVPRSNLLSFTWPDARELNLAWLFQIALALAYRAGGIAGTVLLKTAFVLATWALLFRVAIRRGAHPAAAAAALALAAWAAEPRFVERPHLCTFLGLAILLWALERDEAGRPRALYALVPLALVWANANSCFFLAPVVLGLSAAGAALERR